MSPARRKGSYGNPDRTAVALVPVPAGRAAVAVSGDRNHAISQGDAVTFERLDLAETLGIWRHARGVVVGVHRDSGRPETVDVAFDGHEPLLGYLPDLFRRTP